MLKAIYKYEYRRKTDLVAVTRDEKAYFKAKGFVELPKDIFSSSPSPYEPTLYGKPNVIIHTELYTVEDVEFVE